MRTSQRNKFVVEYKSGRRQSKAPGSSIWGGTDLRALAKEVEDETPILFTEQPAAGLEDDGQSQVQEAFSVNDPKPAFYADLKESGVKGSAQAEAHDFTDVAAATPPTTAAPDLARSKEKRLKQRRPRSADTRTQERALHPGNEPIVSLDEIAALEAENMILRRLRIKQLLGENAALKQMLGRVVERTIAIRGR
jgi:hypothetical protein